MAKPTRFVSVVCACGASFDREVKRGRPQVWCPKCLEVPFYERSREQAPVVVSETGEVTPADPEEAARATRVRIEEGVREVYVTHRAKFAALKDPRGPEGDEIHAETAEALREVYRSVA